MTPVLVTGGSGYVGTQLIAALLRDGRRVRATVRSLQSEGDVRAAVRRGAADDGGLGVVAADLTAGEGWAGAAAGCERDPPRRRADDPDRRSRRGDHPRSRGHAPRPAGRVGFHRR